MVKLSKGKYPRYVTVYDTLIEEIQNGVYKPGDYLPGENQLVKKFDVSRNTLRQAILLLNEDGYVSIQQGKGTKVLKNKPYNKQYLNQLNDSLVQFAINPIDHIQKKIEIRQISPKNQEIFGLDGSNLLLMLQIVYFSAEKAVGCGLIFIPYLEFAKEKISLDDEEGIYQYYLNMFSEDISIESNLKLVTPRAPVTSLMNVTGKNRLFMFDEIAYDMNHKVTMTQKLFVLPEEYDFTFIRKKK